MQGDTLHALSRRRAQIRDRWESFLRIEPVASPLANPDTLVFGIDGALKEIFAHLRKGVDEPPGSPRECACGRNPLHAFFVAGEQALLESLVLAQAEYPGLSPETRDRDFAELRHAIRHVAHREMDTFASLCQLPPKTE